MQQVIKKVKPIIFKKLFAKFSHFKRDERGVTAVEFALISGPFFLLLFAIIEVSLYFFASQVLESSVDAVTRKIRTGQLTGINSKLDFKKELCKEIPILISCDDMSKIYVDVQTAASFDSFQATPEVDDEGEFDPNDFTYVNAGPKEILKVTVVYKWPVFTNYAAPLISKNLNDKALLISSAVVRTEPF